MRIPLMAAASLLLFAACNNAEKTASFNMPGAYKMLYQKIKGGKTDTSYTSLLQQKIYTADYMMYANFNPPDSSCAFGVGRYTKTIDTVIEKVFYNGADSSKTETLRNFRLVITKTETGYKQVIPEIESQGEKFILTEEYENIGKTGSSPVDGAWQMDKAYWAKGKDTFAMNNTQYKFYQDGHFIWGHTYADSTKKIHTGIGFGTFTMIGTDKLKETVPVSSYNDVRGHDFEISLEMNGADAFKQTIHNTDSSIQVEFYKRLKQ